MKKIDQQVVDQLFEVEYPRVKQNKNGNEVISWVPICQLDEIELGITSNGFWLICKKKSIMEFNTDIPKAIYFLPILEMNLNEFRSKLCVRDNSSLNEMLFDSFPFHVVFYVAFKGGGHWLHKALLWADELFIFFTSEVVEALRHVVTSKLGSQSDRHLSKSVLTKWEKYIVTSFFESFKDEQDFSRKFLKTLRNNKIQYRSIHTKDDTFVRGVFIRGLFMDWHVNKYFDNKVEYKENTGISFYLD